MGATIMFTADSCIVIIFIIFTTSVGKYSSVEYDSENVKTWSFGEGFEHLKVQEVHHIPGNREFVQDFIIRQQPLVIRGGAKISPAFDKWNDEYFLSLTIPDSNEVLIETVKKESRTQNTLNLHFQEFVRTYNGSELYMVESVPLFLRQDIVVPCPLRCTGIIIVDSVMWYSSGGTNSVLHTDSVDNLNCLYRGQKHMILVDRKHSENVDLDHPEGSYSSVDVDNVDYNKYPGLATVEYYNVSLNAGDCIFIPYLWFHQVRSYGNNLAVNLWWDHQAAIQVDPIQCEKHSCTEDVTLDTVDFATFSSLMMSPDIIRDRIMSVIGVAGEVGSEKFVKNMFNLDDIREMNEAAYIQVKNELIDMFNDMDTNSDRTLMRTEIEAYNNWSWVMDKMAMLEQLMSEETDDMVDYMDGDPEDFVNDFDHDNMRERLDSPHSEQVVDGSVIINDKDEL